MLLHRACLTLRSSSFALQRFAITAPLNTSYSFRPSSSPSSPSDVVRGPDDIGNEEDLRKRLEGHITSSIELLKEVRPKDIDGYQGVTRALERATVTLAEIRAKTDKNEGEAVDVSRPSSSTSQSSASKSNSVNKDTWDGRYRLLLDYKSREGNCMVPQKHIEGDIKLGRWVDNQRKIYKRGTMPKSRVDLLNEMGFSWDAFGEAWEENLSLLKQFKEREGNCRVPRNHIEGGIKLGPWVNKQRKVYKKGKLRKSRVDLLNEIGFSWDAFGEAWEENLSLLKQYKEREGNCRVPRNHIEGDTKLGLWVDNQRKVYKKGKLPKNRVDLMNEIGFSWDPHGEAWEEKLSLLKQFKEREGHCDVKQGHKEGDVHLGLWLQEQKRARERGTLSKERFQRLQELEAPIE